MTATKPFGFMRFSPGPSVGGYCLPVDPSFLSWRVKPTLRVVLLLRRARQRRQRERTGLRGASARACLQPKGTSDPGLSCAAPWSCLQSERQRRARVTVARARRAPACHRRVRAADHRVKEGQLDPRVQLVNLCQEEAAATDAIVLLSDDAFDCALVVAHVTYVLDTRGRLVRTEWSTSNHPAVRGLSAAGRRTGSASSS